VADLHGRGVLFNCSHGGYKGPPIGPQEQKKKFLTPTFPVISAQSVTGFGWFLRPLAPNPKILWWETECGADYAQRLVLSVFVIVGRFLLSQYAWHLRILIVHHHTFFKIGFSGRKVRQKQGFTSICGKKIKIRPRGHRVEAVLRVLHN
jgi:hypothetical protein